MPDREQLWRGSGVLSVLLTVTAILSAVLVSPAFRWRGNALSNLGVTTTAAGTETTALLFNGGLILGGLLGLGFAAYLAAVAGQRLVGGALALTVVLMGCIGVFPQDEPTHFPVAAGFYLCISLTLWLDGALTARAGWRQRARLSLALGTLNILAWVAWGLTGSFTRPGLAIPEAVGALAFAAWVVLVALERVPGGPATDAGL